MAVLDTCSCGARFVAQGKALICTHCDRVCEIGKDACGQCAALAKADSQ